MPECGTNSGYKAHYARGEKPCGPCRQAHSDYHRARRERLGLRREIPGGCGTLAGYRDHLRRGEPTCAACRAVRAAYTRRMRENLPGRRPARPKGFPASRCQVCGQGLGAHWDENGFHGCWQLTG